MTVKSIENYETKEWLLKKHYAKRMCSISFAFGLYVDNVLSGVITFGMPPSSTLSESICGKEYKNYVLELNRLVVNEGLQKNALSFFVSNAIKQLPNNKIIVSFADANMKHNGYIYQATNFLYTGTSSNTSKLIDKFGKEFHFRNIGHYQKNNKLNVGLVKRRCNEHLIDKKEIANFLRLNKKGYKNNFEVNDTSTTDKKTAENISMTVGLTGIGYEHFFTKHFLLYVYGAHSVYTDFRLRDGNGNNVYTINDENSFYVRTGLKFKL